MDFFFHNDEAQIVLQIQPHKKFKNFLIDLMSFMPKTRSEIILCKYKLNKIRENKEIQGETKDNLTRGGKNKTIIMDMMKTKGNQGWKKRSHSSSCVFK